MNSKIYRCGWCGTPTDDRGVVLSGECWDRVTSLLSKYGDKRTHQRTGTCCPNGDNPYGNWVQVTREMATDAGDPYLEGEWINWP